MKISIQNPKFTIMLMATFLLSAVAFTQEQEFKAKNTFEREGFLFEFSIGAGIISLEDEAGLQSFDDVQRTIAFPELKFGYLLNDAFAITISVPGMIYSVEDYDRHFGGIIPSVQYWVKDRWWIHGGFGLAIDSPALYDIEDDLNDDWNTGTAVMLSTGYEVSRKKNYALNIQSKLFLGNVKLTDTLDRNAVQFSLGVGFSWF